MNTTILSMMELICESLDCKNVNIPFNIQEEQKFGYLNEHTIYTGTCYLILCIQKNFTREKLYF